MLIKKILMVYLFMVLIISVFILPVNINSIYLGESIFHTITIDKHNSQIWKLATKFNDKTILQTDVDYERLFFYYFLCSAICGMLYLGLSLREMEM